MKKKYAIRLLLLAIVAVVLELTVFNFRYYESTFYKEIPYKYECKDNCITVTGIEGVVKNVYVNLKDKTDTQVFDITISAVDEGHSSYYSMPKISIVNYVEKSKYIKLNLSGKCYALKIKIEGKDAELLEFGINQKRCFDFDILRLILVYIALVAGMLLKSAKNFREIKASDNSLENLGLIAAFLCINVVIVILLCSLNPTLIHNPYEHQHQYERLVESFCKGKVYLLEEPPAYMMALDNPYDETLRRAAEAKTGEEYLWDTAYYNGKYYVYFGVVPAVLFYLPTYLITGRHLPNYMCIMLLSIILVVGIGLLLRSVIVRYYKKTSMLMYFALCELCIWGANVWYIAKRPDFYTVPIITALVLSIYGLWFWVLSVKSDKINVPLMMLGSLLMALVAGARPQLLLASALGLVIYIKNWKKNSNIFLFFIPYIVVAGGIMWYNYVRFGSVFDFGAAYNLTIDDMTHRGIVFDRFGLGVYSYIFQPLRISSKFPYVVYHGIETYYQGKTNSENPLAGAFMSNLFLWLGLWCMSTRRTFVNARVKIFAVTSFVIGVLLVLVDIQMGGIYMRYISDFAWLFVIAATVCSLEMYNSYYDTAVFEVFSSCIKAVFVVTMVISFFMIFADVSLTLKNHNPEMFYNMAYRIEFWL